MKKIGFILSIAVLLFIQFSCKGRSDSIEKLWFYTHSNGTVSDMDTMLTPASFISLKRDGSYALDFEKFEYGSWSKDGNTIQLKNSRNQISTITIESFSNNEMLLTIKGFAPANFESQPAKFKSAADNPFSIENNLWRVAADNKESDSEIKMRLLNHLKFWELYFSWALSNELNSIDVRTTPTLIKVYGNGFALKPFDQLPLKWKAYFFDEEDCRKANEMMSTIFKESDIAWAHTDNKYKMFISAFQQLQRKIKL